MKPTNTLIPPTSPTPVQTTTPPYIQTPYGKLTLCSLSIGYECVQTGDDMEIAFEITEMSDDFCTETMQKVNKLMPEKYLEDRERYIERGVKDASNIVVKRIRAFIEIRSSGDRGFTTDLLVMAIDNSESIEVDYIKTVDVSTYITEMKQMVFSLIEQRYFQ